VECNGTLIITAKTPESQKDRNIPVLIIPTAEIEKKKKNIWRKHAGRAGFGSATRAPTAANLQEHPRCPHEMRRGPLFWNGPG
jgi:hypothetical protein